MSQSVLCGRNTTVSFKEVKPKTFRPLLNTDTVFSDELECNV